MAAVQQQYPPEYLAEDRSRVLVNLVIAFAILETLFFVLYVTTRLMSRNANGWDFYLMMPAYLAAMGHNIVAPIMIVHGGVGRHVVAVQPKTVETFLHLEVAEEYIYNFSIFFPKMSILFLYLRIFSTRNYRYSIYATQAVVILTLIVGQLIASVACHPFEFFWDKTIPGGHCFDIAAAYRYISVPNLVTDLCVLILPIYGIWHLNLKTASKFGLSITFLMGCVGIIAGIMRLVVFFQIDLFKDVTYDAVQTMGWTLAEPGVYMMAATFPSLRPLVRYVYKDTQLKSYLDRFSRLALLSHRSSQNTKDDQFNHFDPAIKRETAINIQSDARPAGFIRMSEQKGRDDRSADLSSAESSDFENDKDKHTMWTTP